MLKNAKNIKYEKYIFIIKKIVLFLFLFSVYIFLSAYSYVKAISNDLSDNIFRLHIIANSDSEEDQDLKYIVRDNLIEYMNKICSSCKSKEDVIIVVKNNLDNFTKITEKVISENGYLYPVSVEIGNFDFPTKNYGDISLPSGYYDALRIKIGKSSGKNWWCVMFPPLCFINPSTGIVPEESKETLKQNLSKEDYSIISETNNYEYNFKFKLIEFFKTTGLITAKNN